MIATESVGTCLCGCGVPLKSDRVSFLQGHHKRVPKKEPLPNPPCACGCGQAVTWRYARFIHNHYQRTDIAKVKARVDAEGERQCDWCDKTVWVIPVLRDSWRGACSRACASALKRGTGWNALHSRLTRHMKDRQQTLRGTALEAGVSYGMLQYWWSHRGSSVQTSILDALAKVLGISPDQAIREAGGKTSEQVHTEIGRKAVRDGGWLAVTDHSAAGKKSGKARIGLKLSREVIDRRRASPLRIAADEKAVGAMVAAKKSQMGRIRQSLVGYLVHFDTVTTEQLHQHAERVGTTYGLTGAAVWEIWRSRLLARGLLKKQGRKLLEDRHELVEGMLSTWPRDRSGRPRAFWPHAAAAVSKAEHVDPPFDYETIRQWYIDHRRRCTKTYAQAA